MREIVGVAGRLNFPGEREPAPQIYVPLAQNTWSRRRLSCGRSGHGELRPAVRACGDGPR